MCGALYPGRDVCSSDRQEGDGQSKCAYLTYIYRNVCTFRARICMCTRARARAQTHTHKPVRAHARSCSLSPRGQQKCSSTVRTEQAACTTPTKVCSGHARPHNNALEEGATYHRAMARLGALASIRGRRLGGLRGLTRLGRGCAPHATGDHPRLTAVLGFRFDYEES